LWLLADAHCSLTKPAAPKRVRSKKRTTRRMSTGAVSIFPALSAKVVSNPRRGVSSAGSRRWPWLRGGSGHCKAAFVCDIKKTRRRPPAAPPGAGAVGSCLAR
jgi:hypothetical protein